jgi:hypothetical protein
MEMDFVIGSHQELAPEWADALRAEASGGRIQLHLMEVLEGRDTRVRAFHLHATSAAVMEGLKSIAITMPPDADLEELEQYRPRVQDPLDSDVEMTY